MENAAFSALKSRERSRLLFIDLSHTYDTYDEICSHYGKWNCICPKCGLAGKMYRHAFYERYLCILDQGRLTERKLNILRLKCGGCGSTHAILTMDMIPFYIYSFSLILDIARCIALRKKTVLRKEKESGIAFQTIYRLLSLWRVCFGAGSVLNISDTVLCPVWTQEIISKTDYPAFKKKKILRSHFCLGLLST